MKLHLVLLLTASTAFAFVAVNLISFFILGDDIAHKIRSTNTLQKDDQNSSTSLALELVKKLSQHNCTNEEIRTVQCICGSKTHPDYLKNMVYTYAQSRYDSSLFEKCLNETFPFDENTPLECWPKMYILASYPTGGNELARSILHKTVKRNVFLAQYVEASKEDSVHLYTLKAAGNTLNIHSNNCANADEYQRSMPIGIMGKPTLYKTHGPKQWRQSPGDGNTLTNNPSKGGFTTGGVVRLARNPGDQLIRDSFRWSNRKKCHTHECFIEGASQFCDVAVRKGFDWSNWHEYWFDKSSSTPHIIYHYEKFSNLTHAKKATENVMDFLNELPPQKAGYSLIDELHDVIKEPSYEQGTLMAQVCGKDAAQALHEATKEASKKLGYVFDDISATWSLPTTVSSV